MKKFKKIKNIKLILIAAILIIAILFGAKYIKDKNYIFLYISPDTNTSIFPYISKSSKEINQILFQAAKNLKTYRPEAKIIYTNGYGSGFLKNNRTASDYDYGAGLYLGKYEYNGTNSLQIAEDIIKSISLYQANIYSLAKNSEGKFYIQRMSNERIYGINENENSDAKLMAASIQTALKGKPYNIKVDSSTFLMEPNEIVLPNYQFIKLYNKDISYYPEYKKMLRELTTTIDYYVDIIDKKNNQIYPMTLIASVGDGNRLYQPEFKYFVPNIYTSAASFNYARKIIPNMDNEKYIEIRLSNYFHHYTLLSYGNSRSYGSPLKAVKRLLQCTDIIAPVLPQDVKQQIHNSAYNILKSPTLALLNDYYIANGILYNITKATSLYKELEKNKEVSNHIMDMERILNDMINDPQIKYTELKPLFEYQKAINHSKTDITALQKAIEEKSLDANHYIESLMFKKMPDSKKLNIYITYLNKVIQTAGLYNIKFYQDSNEHIYVLKDDFTKNLKLEDINKLDIVNGFYTKTYDSNTKFEFMNPNDFYGDTRRLTNGWVRYNPNKLQNAIYEDLKKYLIKDKKNYHLRIRPGLQRTNS